MQVNYNDLARRSIQQQYPEMLEKLQKGQVVLPAVFVDGQEVSQGYVDYFSISRALDAARKASASARQNS